MPSEQFDKNRIGLRLGRVHRLWRAVVDQVVSPLGLSQPRWALLMTLRELGDGSSQTQLVEALEIMMPSLTRTLVQLEAQGLIRRLPSKTDKRTKLIYFTAEGLNVLEQLEQKARMARTALLQSLEHDDLVRLEQTLNKIEQSAVHILEK